MKKEHLELIKAKVAGANGCGSDYDIGVEIVRVADDFVAVRTIQTDEHNETDVTAAIKVLGGFSFAELGDTSEEVALLAVYYDDQREERRIIEATGISLFAALYCVA
jgi:hypothetical protein